MKISYTKVTILILVLALVIYGGLWSIEKLFGKGSSGEGKEGSKNYEVLVSVRDEIDSDPEEDRKNSMKKGYVISIYEEGHSWSKTEKISYLILKMNLDQGEKDKLTKSIEKEIDTSTLSREEKRNIEEGGQGAQKESVSLREYKIDLEKIGFEDPKSLLKGQPFEEEVFSWKIVKKVE